jgi:two-component system response regulator NreC
VEVPRVRGNPATARGQWSAAGHSSASQSSYEGLERTDPSPTRVLVADDHAVVRQGLKFLLKREGFAIVAEAVDGRDALRQAQGSRPEVAVLDLSMPGMNGLDAAREIMQVSPETKTIVLTQHTEEQYVLEALRIGVHGYVLKSQGMSDMIQAIRDVQRGRFYLSPGISNIVIDAYREQNSPTREPLTAREREVLQLVAEGKSTKEVADILRITAKTAESHRSRLMLKLGVHDVAGLVRYAVRRGLVEA